MPSLSAKSNPTGLIELDRKRVTISQASANGRRAFRIDRFDMENAKLPGHLRVVVVARAGNTSTRHEMGTVANVVRDARPIDGLDASRPLSFRVLIHEDNNHKLVASVENLRARDDSQSESFFPMEPADLGERLWRVHISEDGPVLQFNSSVFPNAAGVENYIPFCALVLPEAVHQIMVEIAKKSKEIEDEGSPWFPWKNWLSSIGAPLPPDDEDEIASWCNEVVDSFCSRSRFATQLRTSLHQEVEKHD